MSPTLSTQSSRTSAARLTSFPTPLLKTRGEIESGVSVGIKRYQQEYLGRVAKSVEAHLVGYLVVVRLTGTLTAE